MPWECKTVSDERGRFVKEVESGYESKAWLCRKYGISRPTGDKWLSRYKAGEVLTDRPSAPRSSPGRTSEEKEQRILALRREHPSLGAKKIKWILERHGEAMPSAKTVHAILKRNGCVTEEASRAAQRIQRFERAEPNELWQADFKGHFPLGNGQRCHPLNVLDDHSRYSIGSVAQSSERLEPTKASFERLFREHGLPRELLCDNGSPWGTSQSAGYTHFEVWLMDLGIRTIHGRIRHPQTQGKQERFNGSQQRELLRYQDLWDFEQTQQALDAYRAFYNQERPHEALGMRTPAEVYRASSREYPSRIQEWSYGDVAVKKVRSSGYVNCAGQGYFLSEAFGDCLVALIPADADGLVDVIYRQFRVAQISIPERCIVSRKPLLLPLSPSPNV